MVKNFSRDAVIPQVKNLVMLALVNSPPQLRKVLSDGQEIQIGKEQIDWWLTSANARVSDSVTRDRETELIRWNSFIDKAIQVLPDLATPDNMVEALRLGAEMYGFPQSKIDTMLPPPAKVDANAPAAPAMPPVPEMPQPEAQGLEVSEGAMNVPMA